MRKKQSRKYLVFLFLLCLGLTGGFLRGFFYEKEPVPDRSVRKFVSIPGERFPILAEGIQEEPRPHTSPGGGRDSGDPPASGSSVPPVVEPPSVCLPMAMTVPEEEGVLPVSEKAEPAKITRPHKTRSISQQSRSSERVVVLKTPADVLPEPEISLREPVKEEGLGYSMPGPFFSPLSDDFSQPELLSPDIDPEVERLAHRLADLLGTDQWLEQREILQRLRDIGPAARPAVPVILGALKRSDSWYRQYQYVRRAAADAIDAIASDHPDVTGVLLSCMEEGDFKLRAAAARGLGTVGADGEATYQVLCEAAKSDPSSFVREAAVAAIGDVGHGSRKEAYEIVTKAIFDKSSRVRKAAVGVLAGILLEKPDADTFLKMAVEDFNPEVSDAALIALNQNLTGIETE